MGGAERSEERGKRGLDLLNERSIYSQLKNKILLKIWNITLQLHHCFVHVQKNPKEIYPQRYMHDYVTVHKSQLMKPA